MYGLALGYEDLNDHDELRRDPLLAVLAEKEDPTGESRARERDRGKALAGGYPYAELWAAIWGRLQQLPLRG